MKIQYDFRTIEAFRTLTDEDIKKMIERYILNDERINELLSTGTLHSPTYKPMEYDDIINFTQINLVRSVGIIKTIEMVNETTVSVDLVKVKENVIIKAIKPRMLFSKQSQKILFITFDAVAI